MIFGGVFCQNKPRAGIGDLQRDGVAATEPGTFGENVLTRGLDYSAVRAGDRLRVGDEVVLEVFDVRQPCATLEQVDARFPDLMVGRSGFVCRVIAGGALRSGLEIVYEPGEYGVVRQPTSPTRSSANAPAPRAHQRG